ncbi:AraC family transcriptional regulator [Hydrogenophaga crassostreae]|uniref:AraC family transcriptional regulator n=1 Tax=Hydrogenophaga crassostreae TaxID=1763535 RepID=A0A162P1Y1_9BURK|nr:helix-turn-helix domain-containing protein [Hydrogenophaga crassostreae]AOW12465.1 AraC family transcriptional regulator [Hydrogenophaga crassostreae]OAD40330.1 AraC family transcriptional regulator [Hydrogenophaga crassostreae]
MHHLPLLTPRRIDVLVYPGFKGIEAIGAMSVFEYANVHLTQDGRPPGYALRIVSVESGPVASDMHMHLDACALQADPLPHTAIIVGARQIESALAANQPIVDWVAAAAPRIERLVALCSGSFFLSAAGVLDGLPATTHWSVAALLGERFPAVKVQADAIYLRAGHIWTSAGVTAGIDLALALVEEDHGRALALQVARDLVVYLKRPGGQSQFSVHLTSQYTSHPGIREIQAWVMCNLSQPLDVCRLATRAAMSERNFRRVFVKEVGTTPLQFIEAARLEAARRLLEEGDLPFKSVAARIGFASEQSLRKLFIKRLGVAPQAYRERFGGSSGAASPATPSAT